MDDKNSGATSIDRWKRVVFRKTYGGKNINGIDELIMILEINTKDLL